MFLNTATVPDEAGYALIIWAINMALALINYILTAMAIYKVAKVEKVNNPWFAWVPFVNLFLFIKIAEGKMYMLALAMANFVVGFAATAGYSGGAIAIVGALVAAAWSIYAFTLYTKLAERYNVNAILFLLALLAPLALYIRFLGSMYLPLTVIGFFGHYSLYKSACKGPSKGAKIKSKIVASKKKKR